jgi:hypothetical protein
MISQSGFILVGSKRNFFSFKHFFTKILMFLSKKGILRSEKQFRKVDIDLRGQNSTFFFQAFLTTILMFLSKNDISRSAKQFLEVDLDS